MAMTNSSRRDRRASRAIVSLHEVQATSLSTAAGVMTINLVQNKVEKLRRNSCPPGKYLFVNTKQTLLLTFFARRFSGESKALVTTAPEPVTEEPVSMVMTLFYLTRK